MTNKDVMQLCYDEQDFYVEDDKGEKTLVATYYKDSKSICFRNGFRIRIKTMNKIFKMLKQQGEI